MIFMHARAQILHMLVYSGFCLSGLPITMFVRFHRAMPITSCSIKSLRSSCRMMKTLWWFCRSCRWSGVRKRWKLWRMFGLLNWWWTGNWSVWTLQPQARPSLLALSLSLSLSLSLLLGVLLILPHSTHCPQ